MRPQPVIPFGTTFGRWTVTDKTLPRLMRNGRFSKSRYLCKCTCGMVREVEASALLRGLSRSCGCAVREKRALEHERRCAARCAAARRREA